MQIITDLISTATDYAQNYLIIFAICYLLPTLIGFVRRHNSYIAIGILNLLLGWTIIGWIIALIWSFTGSVKQGGGVIALTTSIIKLFNKSKK